jgi:pyruvate dehydrogenase E2 component (dihydrolipoamide acetyltransferase)
MVEIRVPDIGDFKEVEVIEVLVKPGDTIKPEQSLITVESDKASMEIPSSAAGTVKEMKLRLGDKISEGSVILVLEAGEGAPSSAPSGASEGKAPAAPAAPPASAPADAPASAPGGAPASAPAGAPASAPAGATAGMTAGMTAGKPAQESSPTSTDYAVEMGSRPDPNETEGTVGKAHASPSVRHLARELGVDLALVRGSAPKGRISADDIRTFVKTALQQGVARPAGAAGVGGLQVLPWPQVDFAKFGPVERVAMSRIRKLSGPNLHRNWVTIPHVTNHDDADITALEELRVQLNRENEKSGVKVTMLAFLIKACVAALQRFPEFNSSIDAATGDAMILKKYYHIGFAADTPNGLVVPVVRDADRKGVLELARETSALAAKAREGKLSPAEMQGGTFSISSLGGIGGTYFTPIINAPEVAILGVCRAATRPIWDGKQFVPRLILPLSLSWDHRVVDGAGAARFNAYLAQLLADFRRALL